MPYSQNVLNSSLILLIPSFHKLFSYHVPRPPAVILIQSSLDFTVLCVCVCVCVCVAFVDFSDVVVASSRAVLFSMPVCFVPCSRPDFLSLRDLFSSDIVRFVPFSFLVPKRLLLVVCFLDDDKNGFLLKISDLNILHIYIYIYMRIITVIYIFYPPPLPPSLLRIPPHTKADWDSHSYFTRYQSPPPHPGSRVYYIQYTTSIPFLYSIRQALTTSKSWVKKEKKKARKNPPPPPPRLEKAEKKKKKKKKKFLPESYSTYFFFFFFFFFYRHLYLYLFFFL